MMTVNEIHELLLAAHPVGSYYISSVATSPATLFGGTWEQVKDRFILAAGDTYKVGATGGEATHKLTVSEIPAHSHSINIMANQLEGGKGYSRLASSGGYWDSNNLISSVGGNGAHNNMPPYIVAYCWRRTA